MSAFRSVAILAAASVVAAPALAGTRTEKAEQKEQVEERTIFVTGSLIPQRVKLQRIGTTTVSPLRVIDRQEINWTGRRTTAGVLINDPSVRIIGR